MAETDSPSGYNSGDDFILGYGDYTFAFNEVDFLHRTERAARVLELVSAPLNAAELLDLAELTVDGTISRPRSPLAAHINDNHETLIQDNRADGNITQWMRQVLFTEAVLDRQLLEGRLDVEFDEATGNFRYVYAESGEEVELMPRPSWGSHAYHPAS